MSFIPKKTKKVPDILRNKDGNIMLNKKQFLGHSPVKLGYKDIVHVAIVAVRATQPIEPGQRCKFNEFNEAIPGNGQGVADPFVKMIKNGDYFWMLLNAVEVSNVAHIWEHCIWCRNTKRNIANTIGKLLCKLGFHKWTVYWTGYPKYAQCMIDKKKCMRCSKLLNFWYTLSRSRPKELPLDKEFKIE